MTFDVLWAAVEETGILPQLAIKHMPELLSDETKELMLHIDPKELAQALKEVIDAIDHGSVEKADTLLRNRIKGDYTEKQFYTRF